MKKLLIGLLAMGAVSAFAQSTDLAQQFNELQAKGSSYGVAQIRTKGRIMIGLADSVSDVQVYNEAQSYLQLKNGNICNEFVYGKRVTYTCINLVGDTYLERQVDTTKN